MKKVVTLLLALSILAMPVMATAGQKVAQSADPEWWEAPRGTTNQTASTERLEDARTRYTPTFEYEWTDEWENAWNIFLDWSLMLLYYGLKGPM